MMPLDVVKAVRHVVPMLALALVGCSAGSATEASASNAPLASLDPLPSGSVDVPPPACMDAKLVWADALDRLLLVNCVDQEDLDAVERIWAWDGSAWELIADHGPPAMVVTGVAWDAERDVLVRYGGIPLRDDACSAETWEWDTSAWRLIDVEPPVPCDHVEMTWDERGLRVLLVGGGEGSELTRGTWAWDGTSWTHPTDAGPEPRAHPGVVSVDTGALVVGGFDGSRVFDDAWAWNGRRWGELDLGDGPGPRSHHGLAASEGRVLLFGGATRAATMSSLVGETWLLTGGSWLRHEADGPTPSARGLPALGHDPERDVFVLYGGFGAGGAALGDTWEWDDGWRCVDGC